MCTAESQGGCKINDAALGNIRNPQSSSVGFLSGNTCAGGRGGGEGVRDEWGRMEDTQLGQSAWKVGSIA